MDRRTFLFAAGKTLPVLAGYLFLGFAFGLLLQQAGYGPGWALGISLTVYAGSMQFAMVPLLAAGAPLAAAAVLTLSVNFRHFFYGLSFLDRFRRMGAAYPYMVFSLTDETYSVLCGLQCPPGVDENAAFLCIACLHHCYWVAGSVLGACLGQALPGQLAGLDFAMTALFVAILTGQCRQAPARLPAAAGLACGAVCLLVWGEGLLLPALLGVTGLLWVLRGRITRRQPPAERGRL